MKKSSVLLDTFRRHFKRPVAIALALFFPLWTMQVRGATLYYQGSDGPWDTVTPKWSATSNLLGATTWVEGDVAAFIGPSGTITLSEPITASGLIFGSDGNIITGDTLTLSAASGVSSPIINVDSFKRAEIDSIIAGTAGLTKTGNGTLNLINSANSFSGDVSIQGGSVVITDPAQLGTGTTAISITGVAGTGNPGYSGGELVLDGSVAPITITRDISASGRGPGAANGSGALISIGYNNIAGGLTLGSGVGEGRATAAYGITTISGGLDLGTGGGAVFYGNGNWIISGVVSASEGTNDRFVKTGAVLATTLWLQNPNNNFTDVIRIDSGTVRVTDNADLGLSAGTQAVDLNGGTLEVRADTPDFSTRNVNIRGTSGTIFVDRAIGGSGLNENFVFGNLNNSATNGTFIASGRDGNSLAITAPVSNGTLGTGTLGNPVISWINGGNFALTNSGNGTFTINASIIRLSETTGRTLTITATGETVLTGNILQAGTGAVALTKTGQGVFYIQGTASTATGITQISQGTLSISNVASIPSGALLIGNATTTTGALKYTGSTATLANAITINTTTANAYINSSGTGPLTLTGAITNGVGVGGAHTIVLGGSNTGDNTLTSAISTGILGATSLQKIGAGTWVLAPTASNTFTGTTTISGGTLKLQQAAGNFDLLPNAGAVIFNVDSFTQAAGGTLSLIGASGAASTETVGALTATAGQGSIFVAPTGGGSAALTFASLGTRTAGATLDISAAAGGAVVFTAAAGTNGILGGYATYGGTDFATSVSAGGTVGALTGQALLPTSGATATVNYQSTSTPGANLSVESINSLKMSGSQTITLGGTLTVTSGGVLFDNSTGAAIIQNNGTAANTLGAAGSEVIITVNGSILANALEVDALISGSTGQLTKAGTGTLILGGANAFTGNVNINGGSVQLSGPTAQIGASQVAATVLNLRQGATLDLNGAGAAAALYTGGPSVASVRIGTLVGAGTVTNSGGGVGTASALLIGNGTTTTASGLFTGLLSDGSGQLDVVKQGTGTLSITIANTYTGATVINSGTLAVTSLANIGSASGIGAGDDTSSMTNAASLVFNGGTLQYTGATATIFQETQTPSISIDRQFTLAGNGTIDSSGTYGDNVFATTQNNAAIIWNSTADLTFAGAATARTLTLTGSSLGDNELDAHLVDNGAGALTFVKAGAGLWILNPTSSNANTGPTQITGGALQVASLTAAVQGLSPNSNLQLNGGVLQTSGTFNLALGTGAGQVQWTGNGGFAASNAPLIVNLGSGATLNLGTAPTAGSTIILSSTTALADVTLQNPINLGTAARSIQVDDNTSTGLDFATVSGVISGGTGGSLTKTSGGTLILSGANTYTGNTVLQVGALVVTSIGASGTTSSSIGTNVSGGILQIGATTNTPSLLYAGPGETTTRQISLVGSTGTETIDATGSGALVLTNIVNSATGAFTFQLRGNSTGTNMVTSQLTNSGANIMTVTKSDSGVWVLNPSVANTFTGNINANGGTLGLTTNGIGSAGNVTLSNGSIFAYGGDLTSNTNVILSNNTTDVFAGSNNITFGGTLTKAAGANDQTISNNLDNGAVLTFNGNFIDAESTANATRNINIRGYGGTVFNGLIQNNTTTTTNIIKLDIRLSNDGSVTLVANNQATNGFTGGILLGQGTLIAANAGALGAAANTLTLDGGVLTSTVDLSGIHKLVNAAVNLQGDPVTINGSNNIEFGGVVALNASRSLVNNISGGTLTLSGGITNSAASTLNIFGSGETLISAPYNTGTGVSNLTYSGTGSLTLSTANAATGSLTANRSTITLNGAATWAGTIVLNSGGTITLDDSAGTVNRLADAGAVTGAGGTINLIGATGGTTEATGALTINSVQTYITMSGGGPNVLNFASVNFANSGSTLNLGGVSGLGSTNKVTFTAAPSGAAIVFTLTGGAGLIPRVILDGTDFAKYSATNGVTPLVAGDYNTSNNLNTAGVADAMDLSASSSSTQARTIDALKLDGTGVSAGGSSGTRLTITSGGIINTVGNNSLDVPSVSFTNTPVIQVAAGTTLAVNSTLIGSTNLVKVLAGTLQINTPSFVTGTQNLLNGTTVLNGGLNTLFPNQLLNINAGATLDLNGNTQYFAQLSDPGVLPGTGGVITSNGAPALLVSNMNPGSTTLATTINDGTGGGVMTFARLGGNTLTLESASNYSGATYLLGGTTTLQDDATLLNTTSIDINAATLFLSNNTSMQTGNYNRINDLASINLRDGTLSVTGRVDDVASESFGGLTSAQGANTVTATVGGTGTAGAFDSLDLYFASLTRISGTTVNFTGTNLGQQGNSAQILFTTPLTTVSSGALGAWAIANSTDYAAYNSSTGIGVVGTGGYVDYSASFAAGNITQLQAATNAILTTTLPAGTTTTDLLQFAGNNFNNLTFTNPGDTLNLALGGLLRSNNTFGTSIGTAAIPGIITSGTGELIVYDNGSTNPTFGSAAITAGSPVVTGINTSGLLPGMTITNANFPAGTTVLSIQNSGQVTLSNNATATASSQTLTAGVLDTGSTTTGSPTITMASTVGLIPGMTITGTGIAANTFVASVDSGTQVTLSQNATATAAGTITFTAGFSNMVINSVIQGGTSLVKSGAGVLALSAANTYTGGTSVVQGTLNLISPGAGGVASNMVIPAGGLVIGGATLIELTNAGQIDPSNAVTIRRSSTLTLTGNNTLDSITFENNGGTTNPTVNVGGTLTLTNSSPLAVTNMDALTVPTITGGTLALGNGAKMISVQGPAIAGQLYTTISPSLSIASIISGNGPITKSGTGLLQLSAQSTFSGLNVTGGGIVVAGNSTQSAGTVTSGPLGTGLVALSSGTELVASTSNTLANSFSFAGTPTFDATANTTWTLNLTGALSGAGLTGPSITVNVNNPFLTVGLLGSFPGSFSSITKTGAGTLIFNATNYTGDFNATALGNSNAITLINDGDGTGSVQTLAMGNVVFDAGIVPNITINRGGALPFGLAVNKILAPSSITNTGLGLTVSVNAGYGLQVSDATAFTSTPTINVNGTQASNITQGLYLTGNLTGTGFNKIGSGTVVINNTVPANNTFTGNINITQGTLAVATDGQLGNAANLVVLNPSTGTSAFRSTGTFATSQVIQLANTANIRAIEVSNGNTLTLNSAFDLNGGAGNTASLNKQDLGTLVINASNTGWTGQINIVEGAILVNNPALTNPLGTGLINASSTNVLGSVLQLAGGVTINNPITLQGTNNILNAGINFQGVLDNVSGTNTYAGVITQGFDTTIGARVGSTLNITGGIVGAAHRLQFNAEGDINVTTNPLITLLWGMDKFGAGTLTFSVPIVPPTTSGGIQIHAGTLVLNGTGTTLATTGGNIVYNGAALTLDNSGVNTSSRLSGKALTLQGGALNFISNNSTETVGVLTNDQGSNVITLSGSGTAALTFASLTSNAGSGLDVRGIFGTTTNFLKFTASPALLPVTNGILNRVTVNGNELASYSASLGVVAFTNYSPATNILGASATATFKATTSTINSLATSQTINALTINNTAAVGGLNGNPPVSLTLTSGTILANGSGGAFLNTPIVTLGAEGLIHVQSGQTLTVNSGMSGTAGLTKDLAGELDINVQQFVSGAHYINEGTLKLTSTGITNPLLYNQALAVNFGGTLDLNGNNQFVAGLSSASAGGGNGITGGTVTNSAVRQSTFTVNGNTNFAGVISGNIYLNKTSTGALNLQSPQTYTGGTLITGGTLTLNDNGALPNTTQSITINYGGLSLANGNLYNVNDRVNDSAPITMAGGTLSYAGRQQANSTETLGAVILTEGLNYINATTGGTNVNSAVLTLASLTRSAGSTATLRFNGSSNTLGAIGSTPIILVTTAPTLTNSIIGPWAIVDREWASYDSTYGIGQLNQNGFAGYSGTSLVGGPGATDNVRFFTAGTTVLAGNTTVGTLDFASQTTATVLDLGGNTLTVQGGGILFAQATDNVDFSIQNGTITGPSGGGDLYLTHANFAGTNRTVTLNAPIADNGGATRVIFTSGQIEAAGVGYTNLNAVNTNTGGTVINSGNIVLGATGSLGTGGLTVNQGIFTQTLGGVIPSSNVLTMGGASTVNLANQANTLASITFNNLGGAAPIVTPTGTLTLTSGIAVNTVNAGGIATIGAGNLDLNGAGSFAINVGATVVNGVDVAPWQAGLNISALIQNGGITKSGAGLLQLSSTLSTFSGGINVTGGGLVISASSTGANLLDPVSAGPLGTGAVTMASGTTLVSTGAFAVANDFTFLGDTALNGTNSLTLNGNTTLPSVWNVSVTAPNVIFTIGNVVGSLGSDVANKSGLGQLVLGNYNGTINIAGGLILSADGNTLGTPESLSLGGGIVLTADTQITVNKSGGAPNARNKTLQKATLSNNGSILAINNLNGYGLEITGNTILTGASTLAVGTASASNVVQGLTLSGVVSDTGGFTLVKSGVGTLTLNNSGNTFGGAGQTIDVLGGILSVNSDGALGNAANTITLEVDGTTGSGFRATGTFSTARTFLLNAPNNAFEVTQGNTLTLTTPFSLLSATNTLTKNDNGVFAISADNTGWTGTITLNGGAIEADNSNALGSGTVTVVNTSGSALQLKGGVTVANLLSIGSSGVSTTGALRSIAGSNIYSGAITLTAASTIGADAGSLELQGGVSGAFALTLAGAGNISITTTALAASLTNITKINSGTATLGVNSPAYVGTLTINAGSFVIAGSGIGVGGTGLITVNPTGSLSENDSSGAASPHLGGRAMTLAGGTFSYLGNAGTSAETFGTLTTNRPGDTVSINNNGGSTSLTYASLGGTGNIVTLDGALNFVSTGAAFGTTGANSNRILFTTAPTLTNSIIQRATVNGADFATYGANGIAAFTAYNAGSTTNINSVTATTGTADVNAAMTTKNFTANKVLNAIRLSGATNQVVGATGTNFLAGGNTPAVLTLSAGAVIATGGGSHQIATPILAPGISSGTTNVQDFFSVDSATTLTITSVLTGNAGWVKAGAGTLILAPPTSSIDNRTGNTITGNATITGGTVILNGGNNTLVANQNMLVGPGATLDLNGNSQFVQILFTDTGAVEGAGGAITSTGVNAANGTLVTNQDNNTRNWAGTLTGALSFARGGQGTMVMFSNNDYTGSTLISGGATTLKDGGLLSGTSAIEIVYSTLTIDNTGTKDLTDRINDTAAINLRGGTLAFLGRAQTASTETVGVVSLLKGNSFINSTTGGTGINSADFTLTSLNRAVGGGTVNFTAATGGQIGSSARILIPTINGVSTATVGGGLTNGIIGGWAIIGTSDFATYIPGLGVAPMGANGALQYSNTTSTAATLNSASATDNISINVAVPGNTVPVSNDLTINSLRLGNIAAQTVDIAAGKTLTLSSGGLLFFSTASQKIGSAVNQGSLTTTGPELFIYTQGTGPQIINSVITGSGVTVVKSGANALTLNGANTYGGGTTINQGTLTLGLTSNIPLATDPTKGLILNGSSFTESAPGQIAPGNIVTINGNSSLTLLGDNTLAGLIFRDDGGGVGASQVVSNLGVLTIAGNIVSTTANPSSTSTLVGRVDFASANRTLDIGSTNFNGQELAALLSDFNLQGIVNSAGGITKIGNGVLQFNAPDLYTGTTTVNAGRIQVGVLNGGSRFSDYDLNGTNTGLNLNGLATVLGSISGTGYVTNSGAAATLTVGFDGSSTIFSGTFLRFNDAVTNAVSLNKIGTGTLTFDSSGAASTTTGSLSVSRGAVTFKDNGTSSFENTAVIVNEGGTLNLDDSTANSVANVANRLLGGALTLNGGTLNVLGVNGAATTDLAGILTLGPSASNINLIAGAGGTVVETFASLSQIAGSTAIISGTNLGTDTILKFTTAPTLVPAATGILARIAVGTDFATYNSTNGIIAFTGYVTPMDINSAAGTATIRVDATTTGRTLNLGRTINALDIIDNNVTLISNGSLLPTQGWTVTSGGILVNGNAATISTPVLALGAEGIFRINGSSLNVTSSITGTAGITKTGSGSMTLSTLESYTGQTALNLGTLILAGGNNTLLVTPTATIPGVADIQVNGGLLDLNGYNQAVRTLLDSNTLAFIAGEITNSSATAVTLTTAMNSSSVFGGKISGNLGLTRSGNNTLTLVDVQTYTGPTIIRGGGLTLQDTGTLATSSIAVYYGTLTWNNNNLDPLANLNPVRILATTPLTLQGGTFSVNGGGSFDTSATINILNIAGGQNTVNVAPLVNQGSSADIIFGNLVRSPTDTSVVVFNGFMNAAGSAPAASTLGGAGESQNGNIFLNQINGAAGPVSYVLAATTTLNSATVTVSSTTGLAVGMAVNGANIPVGATIASIVNGTTFTLNSGTGVVAGTNIATNINSGLTNNLIGGWAVADGSTFATYLTGAGVSVMGQTTQGNIAPNFDGTNISATTLATQNINDGGTARTITGAHVANSLRTTGVATVFTLSSASSLSLGVGWITNGNVAYNLTGTDSTSTLTSPNAALYIYINSNTTSINANITGGTALVKAGGSALTLNNSIAVGNNTYTGGTFVQAGTLNLSAAAANIVVIPAGGLTINNATVTMNTNSGQIDASNDVSINGGGVLTTVGTNTLNSVIFNNAGGTATPTLNSAAKLNFTAATPITATNDNYSTTPTINGTEIGLVDGAIIVTSGLSPDNLIISAKISTAAATAPLVKSGTGSLVLSSTTSTFANGFNLNQGSLIFAASSTPVSGIVTAGPIGTGALNIANGTAVLSDGTARTIANVINVAGDFIFGTPDNATSRANAANSLTLSGTITLAAGAHNITVGGLLMTGTLSGQVTGGTNLSKDGLGTLVLSSTSNNYGGSTTITAGTLQLGAAGVIPDTSAFIVATNGNVNVNGFAETVGSLAGAGLITNTGAAATLTTGGDGTSTTFSGTLSNQTNALNLVKILGGTQTLTGTNSYTGTTAVNAGVLNIQNNTALGTTTGGTAVASGAALEIQGGITVGAEALNITGTGVAGGGALRNISGTNVYGGTVTLGAGGATIQSDAGLLTVNAAPAIIATTQPLTVQGAGDTAVSGAITGTTATLTKNDAGLLTLSGANTTAGDLTVNAGEVDLNTTAANAWSGNAVVNSTGTLKLLQSNQIADAQALTVAGGTFSLNGLNETVAGVSLTSGGFILDSVGGGALTSTTDFDLQSGTASGVLAGSVGATKSTGDTVVLSGANTYTGQTAVNGGTLSISADNNLGAVPGSVVADQLTMNGGVLQTTADVNITSNRGITMAASGGTFETVTSTTTTVSSVITGGGVINKTGGGTLLFTAINTNTGATNVNVGTLGGTGTLGGDLNVNSGGTVAPGISAAGLLTIGGNLTVNSGGTLLMQLGGATLNDAASVSGNENSLNSLDPSIIAGWESASTALHDHIVSNGASAPVINGTLQIDSTFLNGYAPAFGDVLNLLDWSSLNSITGATTFDYSGITLSGDLAFNSQLFANYGIIVIVPEPGRAVLLMFGLLGLLMRRRRHRAFAD